MKLKLLFLSLFISVCSGCVTIKEKETCSIAGMMSGGGFCEEMISKKRRDLDVDQFIDFLEPRPKRPDPDNPEQTLPEKAAAVCLSAQDFAEMKTELELMCRLLGKRCSYEIRKILEAK